MEKKLRILDLNYFDNRIASLKESMGKTSVDPAIYNSVINELGLLKNLLSSPDSTRDIIGEVYAAGYSYISLNAAKAEKEYFEDKNNFISNLIKE